MDENDMNNIINQLNTMLKDSGSLENIKNIFDNLKNSSTNSNSSKEDSSYENPEIDINTILKLKKVMDSMNSKKDDPRSNLLLSLKPYLKESRRKKVDEYVKLFGLGKAFEVMNSLGGDKNDK